MGRLWTTMGSCSNGFLWKEPQFCDIYINMLTCLLSNTESKSFQICCLSSLSGKLSESGSTHYEPQLARTSRVTEATHILSWRVFIHSANTNVIVLKGINCKESQTVKLFAMRLSSGERCWKWCIINNIRCLLPSNIIPGNGPASCFRSRLHIFRFASSTELFQH